MSLTKKLTLFSVMTMLLLGGALQVSSQRSTTTRTDPEFNAFWIKLKAAVARNDKETVADLTKLPFWFDGKERDRAGFIKHYSSLFTPRVSRCFARARPSRDQEIMEIFCGDEIFVFAKVDGVYKFTEIGAND